MGRIYHTIVAVLSLALLSTASIAAGGRKDTQQPVPVEPAAPIMTPVAGPDRQEPIMTTLTVALDTGEETLHFDPHLAPTALSALASSAVAEGLTIYSQDAREAVPGLAASWSRSDDGLVWIFTIRDNARFSDGTSITARNFVESWLNLLSPNNPKASYSSFLDNVKGAHAYRTGAGKASDVGIQAIDPSHLVVTLKYPAPYLDQLLALPGFAAIHPAVLAGTVPPGTLSSGPFILAHQDEDGYTLIKNRWYYAAEELGYETLRLDIRGPGTEVYEDYKKGMIQWSQVYIPEPWLVGGDVQMAPQYSTDFFYFSTSEGPYARPAVRQALLALLDIRTIRTLKPLIATSSLVPFSTARLTIPTGTQAERKAKALDLLAAEGFADTALLPPITIAVHRGSQTQQTAEYIAETWSQELGITVILDTVPLAVYATYPETSPYDIATLTWIGDFPSPQAFLSLWQSDSSYNLGKYTDSVFDSLMAQAYKSPETERSHYLVQAEQRLLDQGAVYPLTHGISVNFVNTRILTGWSSNSLDMHPWRFLRPRT